MVLIGQNNKEYILIKTKIGETQEVNQVFEKEDIDMSSKRTWMYVGGLFCVGILANLSFGETNAVSSRWSVGLISLSEATTIKHVEELAEAYPRCSEDSEKQETIEELQRIYENNGESFLGVVVLTLADSLDKLDVLSAGTDPLLDFAKRTREGVSSVSEYVHDLNDPGLQTFLRAWYVCARTPTEATEQFQLPRAAEIQRLKVDEERSLTGVLEANRSEHILNRMVNWDTPLSLEACTQILIKEHSKNPGSVVRAIRSALPGYIPANTAPPYTKTHTTFNALCLATMAIGDQGMTDTFVTLAAADNPYVAEKSAEVLKWLAAGTKYPIKYHELRRLYDSRS